MEQDTRSQEEIEKAILSSEVLEKVAPEQQEESEETEEHEMGESPNTDSEEKPRVLRDPVTGRLLKGSTLNPVGRPKGVRNLTTIVLETLRNKKIRVKDPDTGKIKIIRGDEAFAEAVLHNALKKQDRETLRMIWEFSDGKPVQQHKIEATGPRGFLIDPEKEKMLDEQFNLYTPRNAPLLREEGKDE